MGLHQVETTSQEQSQQNLFDMLQHLEDQTHEVLPTSKQRESKADAGELRCCPSGASVSKSLRLFDSLQLSEPRRSCQCQLVCLRSKFFDVHW